MEEKTSKIRQDQYKDKHHEATNKIFSDVVIVLNAVAFLILFLLKDKKTVLNLKSFFIFV